jgi:hypothetical protein
MQVIGDSYKTGKDTILYYNKKTGWIIKNKEGVAIYDSKQIVGNGSGLGVDINQSYINAITQIQTIVSLENGNIVKEERIRNKSKKEVMGKQKEVLKHPRY